MISSLSIPYQEEIEEIITNFELGEGEDDELNESADTEKSDEEFEKEWDKLNISDNAEIYSVEDANKLIDSVVKMKW